MFHPGLPTMLTFTACYKYSQLLYNFFHNMRLFSKTFLRQLSCSSSCFGRRRDGASSVICKLAFKPIVLTVLCWERDDLKGMKSTHFVCIAQAAAPPSETNTHRASGKVEISWRWIYAVYS